MPLVRNTANSNIRRRSRSSRRETFFSSAGPTIAVTPVAIEGSAVLEVSGGSDISQSINALKTYDKSNGYGREASIEIFATGYLELETYPLDSESAFVMIRRVSPIMPDSPTLDDRGRPT